MQPIVFNKRRSWTQGTIGCEWDLIDKTKSTESDPIHAYNVNATTTYNINLKVKITGGYWDASTKQITINEGPKNCDFQAKPDYSFGFYGMKFEPTNASGVTGAQAII